jgi:hypothetical protein
VFEFDFYLAVPGTNLFSPPAFIIRRRRPFGMELKRPSFD